MTKRAETAEPAETTDSADAETTNRDNIVTPNGRPAARSLTSPMARRVLIGWEVGSMEKRIDVRRDDRAIHPTVVFFQAGTVTVAVDKATGVVIGEAGMCRPLLGQPTREEQAVRRFVNSYRAGRGS